MLSSPKGGHPTLKVKRIKTPNVKCGIARIDMDFLAGWRQTFKVYSEVATGLYEHGSFEMAACPREIWSRTGSPGPDA
jgi:hypothetical protein